MKPFRKVLVLLQVLSFIPFFFGSFLFIVQTFTNFRIIPYVNEYKPGVFIVINKEWDDAGRNFGGHYYANGTIGKDTVRLSLRRILQQKERIRKGDSVNVWYRDNKYVTLVRDQKDTKFPLHKYIYDIFPSLMLFGIPPFIIITYILRRMKKKSLNQNNLQ